MNSPPPSLFVIFGARGDLTRRKLLPALHRLLQREELRERVHLLGVGSRADVDDEGFRAESREALRQSGVDAAGLQAWCDHCLHYQCVGRDAPEDFARLAQRIEALEREHHLGGDRAFYLALPPVAFPTTIAGLGGAGLNQGPGWTRLVIEKPFGRDLDSARQLDQLVHRYFREDQVYRIDHYLGKETVQNLLVLRFANAIFELLWNRDHVQSVQITVAEDLGVEGRGRYYETAGALRDMVQSHLTQLLTLIAMEIPVASEDDAVRNEKVKVLRSLAPIRPEDVVFGQYTRGAAGARPLTAYREEPDVARDSAVETFVALRLGVVNWRWYGVPFYIRTGKRMPRRATTIAVVFHRPPVSIFRNLPGDQFAPNVLRITIQPDEGFQLDFEVKAPGAPIKVVHESLRFHYAEKFARLPDAYETLLLDILLGDQTLFVRSDVTEEAWRIYAPVMQSPPPVELYAAGSWGPAGADALLARFGHTWLPV